MTNIRKRMAACIAACAVSLTALGSVTASGEIAKENVILSDEAENLTVTEGAQIATKVYNDEYPGFSGDAFVWAGNAGGVSFEVDLAEGAMYEVTTRCLSYLGDRLQTLAIDGEQVTSITINKSETWEDISFGFFYIEKGKHTIEIGASGSWGFMLYDTVTFGKATMPKLEINPTPCDPKATAETKSLMQFLSGSYGKQVLTGQQEIYGSGHDGNYEYEFDYLKETTGKLPAVRGFDFMNYNPLYGWDDNTTERVIDWGTNQNGIVTACWHINVPINFTDYTLGDAVDWKECTYKNIQASNGSFHTEKILDKTSKERAYFDEAVKMLAEQLLRAQEAGVPIILRPLHEAQGNYGRYGDGTAWFWWGDQGPEVYKELWKLLYTELTDTYGVHNLIWELNLYELDNSIDWYPGPEYVDIIAYDKYEGSPYRWGTDPATSVFLSLVGDSDDTKMVALAECDKIPDITKIRNEGAWWLYVCPWYDDFITSENNNTKALLKEFYNSEYVLTLDELPADLYKGGGSTVTTVSTATTTTTTSTTVSGTGKVTPGDVNCDGKVTVSDAIMLARVLAEDSEVSVTDQGLANAEVDGTAGLSANDTVQILKMVAGIG